VPLVSSQIGSTPGGRPWQSRPRQALVAGVQERSLHQVMLKAWTLDHCKHKSACQDCVVD